MTRANEEADAKRMTRASEVAETNEDQLTVRVRGAYEAMGPSKEAEERMLSVLLAAESDRKASEQDVIDFDESVAPARTMRRRWWVALPAAACLVVAFVVGRAAFMQAGAPEVADAEVAYLTSEGVATEAAEDVLEEEMAEGTAVGEAFGTDMDAGVAESAGSVENAGAIENTGAIENAGAMEDPGASEESSKDAGAVMDPAARDMAEGAPFSSVTLDDGTVLVPVEDAEPLHDHTELGAFLGDATATLVGGEEAPCQLWERTGETDEYLVRIADEDQLWAVGR